MATSSALPRQPPEPIVQVVGYIRVSTEEQEREGISLDVQRERLVSYCQHLKLKLISIYSDEHTGRDMNRAGLRAALAKMVETGATFIVVSLDRVSRSVADWLYLLEHYFGYRARHRLLALDCVGLDPKTATGETILLMRAVWAYGEVAQTRERTRLALQYLKSTGVSLGGLPFGKAYTNRLDKQGHRIIVEVPEQMATIRRIVELHQLGTSLHAQVRILNAEGRKTAKGHPWTRIAVQRILAREGYQTVKHWDRSGAIHDSDAVLKRIAELRAAEMSYKDIGVQLTREKLLPPSGLKWHATTVKVLWETAATYNPKKSMEIAARLRRAGYSLSQIGQELTAQGLTPARGGIWHGAQVRLLLLMTKGIGSL